MPAPRQYGACCPARPRPGGRWRHFRAHRIGDRSRHLLVELALHEDDAHLLGEGRLDGGLQRPGAGLAAVHLDGNLTQPVVPGQVAPGRMKDHEGATFDAAQRLGHVAVQRLQRCDMARRSGPKLLGMFWQQPGQGVAHATGLFDHAARADPDMPIQALRIQRHPVGYGVQVLGDRQQLDPLTGIHEGDLRVRLLQARQPGVLEGHADGEVGQRVVQPSHLAGAGFEGGRALARWYQHLDTGQVAGHGLDHGLLGQDADEQRMGCGGGRHGECQQASGQQQAAQAAPSKHRGALEMVAHGGARP